MDNEGCLGCIAFVALLLIVSLIFGICYYDNKRLNELEAERHEMSGVVECVIYDKDGFSIMFKDRRSKRFKEIPPTEIIEGKEVKLIYNGKDKVIDVSYK